MQSTISPRHIIFPFNFHYLQIEVLKERVLVTLRVLSHLVRLPGPNQSLFAAPAGLCSYYFIWVRTAVRLRHQASSCLPCCLVTTTREKAAKCIRLLSALLYIYVFEPFILFTKLQCITALTSVL